ncbi:hypothetical protein JMJ55_14005 [Belnapia sp. T6]|uniref:Uncharacterized protein n=1 Tax=Belnapia mucosa TaxID=2804532 RepID=A0ABS1V430_9PROT|nr:hypothetical protein [Belnapia mucosa]MBL6456444.1 hypothetical protein [Belnapia mucosa]
MEFTAMLIEASSITTRYGQTGRTSTLRYVAGGAMVLVVLFGLFLLAGLDI